VDLIGGLKTFLRVAQTGSFSAVASERGVTQPAISRQVSALEEHLGTRLVQRSTQAVTLTEEGRDLLEPAQRLIDDADALQFAMGERRGKAVGCVKIAMPVALGIFLSERLKPLLRQHEGLTIDLVLRDGTSNLIEDGLDLEIRLGPLDDTTMIARLIGRTTAYLVATPEYLAAHPPLRHPRDLQHHDCIVHPRWALDSRWWFSDSAEGNKGDGSEIAIAVAARIQANNAAAVYRAALAGAGVALLSHLLVTKDIEAGRLQQLLPEYPARRFPIYLLYPSKRILPPRTRVLIEYLSTLLGNDPDMAPPLPTQAG
jgi:DNA-binding transcriptional LysR family regulator